MICHDDDGSFAPLVVVRFHHLRSMPLVGLPDLDGLTG
ncbi:MAG: hypothetical protein OJF47_003761 [Nitrospira sp.]|nr:MAG: hypothetical protein OJF47_003761 [Nitrospira sp.]